MHDVYLLFREKNISPCDYFKMTAGQKRVTRAFLRFEIEERNKEYQEYQKKMK